jgi:hypothetical protein
MALHLRKKLLCTDGTTELKQLPSCNLVTKDKESETKSCRPKSDGVYIFELDADSWWISLVCKGHGHLKPLLLAVNYRGRSDQLKAAALIEAYQVLLAYDGYLPDPTLAVQRWQALNSAHKQSIT